MLDLVKEHVVRRARIEARIDVIVQSTIIGKVLVIEILKVDINDLALLNSALFQMIAEHGEQGGLPAATHPGHHFDQFLLFPNIEPFKILDSLDQAHRAPSFSYCIHCNPHFSKNDWFCGIHSLHFGYMFLREGEGLSGIRFSTFGEVTDARS